MHVPSISTVTEGFRVLTQADKSAANDKLFIESLPKCKGAKFPVAY